MTLDDHIARAEKLAIAKAILSAGSLKAAASSLGTNYIRIYRRMRHYQIPFSSTGDLRRLIDQLESAK